MPCNTTKFIVKSTIKIDQIVLVGTHRIASGVEMQTHTHAWTPMLVCGCERWLWHLVVVAADRSHVGSCNYTHLTRSHYRNEKRRKKSIRNRRKKNIATMTICFFLLFFLRWRRGTHTLQGNASCHGDRAKLPNRASICYVRLYVLSLCVLRRQNKSHPNIGCENSAQQEPPIFRVYADQTAGSQRSIWNSNE